MKKWRQLFQSFFTRHIAAPEPVVAVPAKKEFTPDLQMNRFTALKSLKAAKTQEPFFLSNSTGHPDVMDELRMEGWIIELRVDAKGKLGYAICVDRTNLLS